MATWTVTAQLSGGTTGVLGATDRIWFNGAAFGDNVAVNSYQDTTHLSTSSDVHMCSGAAHVNNTKYIGSANTYSLNGTSGTFGATSPTTATCPWKFTFADASSVATSNGKFYAYDGVTDVTPMVGINFYAFEKVSTTNTPAWVAANGSASALGLTDQAASTSHDFFIGMSVSPTSNGAKTGKVKISLTYV